VNIFIALRKDTVDVAGRLSISLQEVEVGVERSSDVEVFYKLRSILNNIRVTREKQIDLVQKTSADMTLDEVVEEVLVSAVGKVLEYRRQLRVSLVSRCNQSQTGCVGEKRKSCCAGHRAGYQTSDFGQPTESGQS